jgi:hypothetical protein
MHIFSRSEIEAWGIEREPEAVRAELGLGPLPTREENVATLTQLVQGFVGNEALLRAVAERGIGTLPTQPWTAVRTILRTALLEPASASLLLDTVEAEGLTVEQFVSGDGPAFGPFLVTFAVNVAYGGMRRLPLSDREAYFGFVRDAIDWRSTLQPQSCSDIGVVTDGALSAGYLASLDRPDLTAYRDLMLRAVEAELTDRPPDAPASDTQRFAAEDALASAVGRVASNHPRGEEMFQPRRGQPYDFCLAAEIWMSAMQTLPRDIRADTMLLMFDPVPYR